MLNLRGLPNIIELSQEDQILVSTTEGLKTISAEILLKLTLSEKLEVKQELPEDPEDDGVDRVLVFSNGQKVWKTLEELGLQQKNHDLAE